jgi:hypothetical protein
VAVAAGHDVGKRSHLRPVTGNSPGEGESTAGFSHLRKSSNWSGFVSDSLALTTQSSRVRDQDSFTSYLVSAYFLDVRDTRRYPVTPI